MGKLGYWQVFFLIILSIYIAFSLYVDFLYDPTPDTFFILVSAVVLGWLIIESGKKKGKS
jgi:hypothetical protein